MTYIVDFKHATIIVSYRTCCCSSEGENASTITSYDNNSNKHDVQ